MVSIQKITLKELEEFVYSKKYLALKNKPISKARVLSYLQNPRANKNDVVLYMAFLNNQLVAYRTILPDAFFIDNKPTFFGWLSGNWVAEKHRRKGFSMVLFNEVFKDWQGKLMYTNYAVASKLVYDKTAHFRHLKTLKGTKYYLRFCLADILPNKKKIFKKTHLFWLILDTVLNIFLDIKNVFTKKPKGVFFNVKETKNYTKEILKFTDSFTRKNLFKRNEVEFNWIQDFPWVLTDKDAKIASKHYNFSSYSKNFESTFYTIYNNKNILIGCLLLTIRNGHLKIPYAYFSKKNSKTMASFIIDKCAKITIKTMVIYEKDLESELNNQLKFITKKVFTQKYFLTKKLKKEMKPTQEIVLQTGDGDVVFT